MNYLESIAYIESLIPTAHKPLLERMRHFMKVNGNLQNSYPSIHVGGTNGKGSTTAIMDSILRKFGKKVGRYTGPHLLNWNERFHIDGRAITNMEFARLLTNVRELSENFGEAYPEFGKLTWFELLTAMAFFYFASQKVDIAIFEVGLGGRFDATNVIDKPSVTVITNVNLDHTHLLGNTVSEIASEKGGIIKDNVPLVTAATGDASNVILAAAKRHLVSVIKINAQQQVILEVDNGDLPSNWLENLEKLKKCLDVLPLFGDYQRENSLLALTAVFISNQVDMSQVSSLDTLRQGCLDVYWPGRMQILKDPKLILDGAHNSAGAIALRKSLESMFGPKKFKFVIGCFDNKDVDNYMASLIKKGDQVFACEAKTSRKVTSVKTISKVASDLGATSYEFAGVQEAVEGALKQMSPDEPVIVTGSFAVLKETMLYLGWKTVEDGLPAS